MRRLTFLTLILCFLTACTSVPPTFSTSPGSEANSHSFATVLRPAGSGESLFPFAITLTPPLSNVTNVAGWLERPAGKDGPIRIENGHFVTGSGRRIRFWGANLVFGANFPTVEEAETLARSLARWGINIVRLHHMDTRAAPDGIWQAGHGIPRRFDPETLDRLDYLESRLVAAGIYVDLNLHVGRALTPEEGFPDLPGRPQHDKGISFFDPLRIAADKAYAREILSHVNPYTGKSWAKDPGVALVEITNENGPARSFWAGDFDHLPVRYAAPIRALWNAWLRDRYLHTAALAAVWENPADVKFPSGDLLTGEWQLEQSPGGSALLVNGPTLAVTISSPGQRSWGFNLNRPLQGLRPGAVVEVKFRARADAVRKATVSLMQAKAPWQNVGIYRELALTPQWQEFRLYGRLSDLPLERCRLTFSNLRDPGARYEFAGVSVRLTPPPDFPTGRMLEEGEVALPRKIDWGSYTETCQKDWMRFLWESETAYYTAMVRYLKHDLGVAMPVTGSQMGYSIGPVQANLDYIDAHAYWEHPIFPHRPWDRKDWYIPNSAMVNTPGGTIGRLGLFRVAGKPYTISEYNHPVPNTYRAEGFILAAAYAAFQDWDGVFFYNYSSKRDYSGGSINDWFEVKGDPVKLVTLPAVAAILVRGDVRPGPEPLVVSVSQAAVINALVQGGPAAVSAAAIGVPAEIVLTHRLAVRYATEAKAAVTGPGAINSWGKAELMGPGKLSSDTGELCWDRTDPQRGYFTLRSRHSLAVTGFIAGRSVTLGDITVSVGPTRQGWATLTLTEMTAGRWLLTATGYAENMGMQLRTLAPGRVTVANQFGDGPPLVEGITATIRFPYPAAQIKAWALDTCGEQAAELPVVGDGEASLLYIGPGYKTLWYEVQVVPQANKVNEAQDLAER